MTPEILALVDRQKIAEVGLRYVKAGDTRDRALLCACFTSDGVWSMPFGEFVGIDAISNAPSILSAFDVTQHVITNQEITIDGDAATMVSQCIATHIQAAHSGGPVFTVGGVYFDELRRCAGEWRIARRTGKVLWSTGNAAMMAGPPER